LADKGGITMLDTSHHNFPFGLTFIPCKCIDVDEAMDKLKISENERDVLRQKIVSAN
jgi:hypothetical protein